MGELNEAYLRALGRNVAETGSFASFNSNKGGANATASFGSTTTDFDNMTCPGAQAELDEAYLRACGIGGAANLPAAAAGFPPSMPFGWFGLAPYPGASVAALSAQAASLELTA